MKKYNEYINNGERVTIYHFDKRISFDHDKLCAVLDFLDGGFSIGITSGHICNSYSGEDGLWQSFSNINSLRYFDTDEYYVEKLILHADINALPFVDFCAIFKVTIIIDYAESTLMVISLAENKIYTIDSDHITIDTNYDTNYRGKYDLDMYYEAEGIINLEPLLLKIESLLQ